MEWGRWIIHPVQTVTLCLHNTELLFGCISSNTEFTHFDNAHISLRSTTGSFNLALMANSPESVFRCLCLFWLIFPALTQHLLPSCPCLFPPCYVSWTRPPCSHLPLIEGQLILMQRGVVPDMTGSHGMKTQASKLVRVGHLHLITWLSPCIWHIQVWES